MRLAPSIGETHLNPLSSWELIEVNRRMSRKHKRRYRRDIGQRRADRAVRNPYIGETASAIPLMTPQRCMKVSQS